MRLPLRFQIVVPLTLVILLTMVSLAIIQANIASKRTRSQIESQLQSVARTLESSSFPLTMPVLLQMKGLTGSDFVLAQPSGATISTIERAGTQADEKQGEEEEKPQETSHATSPEDTFSLSKPTAITDWHSIRLKDTTEIQGKSYFHVRYLLNRHGRGAGASHLNILYPVEEYRSARWDAVAPSAALGAAAVLTTVLCGFWIARTFCKTVSTIRDHVDQVAQGEFIPLEPPPRNDELRDLAENVNRMSQQLALYEEHVRHTEQLRTLSQLGAGMAHEIRNAITGTRLALQIHEQECPIGADCESLEVAQRQTHLIETHVQRLLSLGTPVDPTEFKPVDLETLVEDLLPLAKPLAAHLGVMLKWPKADATCTILGDKEALGQVFLNLLFNAIEAVSRDENSHKSDERPPPKRAKEVVVTVQRNDQGVTLCVSDSGSGPSGAIVEKLFEPFASDKADGMGLGLSVSQQIVASHHGTIRWDRQNERTRFLVELPLSLEKEIPRVKTVGH